MPLFTWLVLLMLGEPNGFLASVLAGLIMMIPFIGSFGAFVPPLLLVLLQTPNDQLLGKALVLCLLLIVAQQIALQLIAPRVFGKTLGVNPLILFAALLLARSGVASGARSSPGQSSRFSRRSARYSMIASPRSCRSSSPRRIRQKSRPPKLSTPRSSPGTAMWR